MTKREAEIMDQIAHLLTVKTEVGAWELENIGVMEIDFPGYAELMIAVKPHLFKANRDKEILFRKGDVDIFMSEGGFTALYSANESRYQEEYISQQIEIRLKQLQIEVYSRSHQESRLTRRLSVIAIIVSIFLPLITELVKLYLTRKAN